MKLFQEEAEAVSVRPQFYVLFLFSTAATVSGWVVVSRHVPFHV